MVEANAEQMKAMHDAKMKKKEDDKVKEKKVPGFLSWLHAMKSITFPVPFALLCAAVGFVLWITNGLGTNDILSGHRYSDREYRTMETTHTLSYKIFGYLLGFWLVTRLLVCTNRFVFSQLLPNLCVVLCTCSKLGC